MMRQNAHNLHGEHLIAFNQLYRELEKTESIIGVGEKRR